MNIFTIFRSLGASLAEPTKLPNTGRIALYRLSSSGQSYSVTPTARSLARPSTDPPPLNLRNGSRRPKPDRSPPARYFAIISTQMFDAMSGAEVQRRPRAPSRPEPF